jgi:NAD(P)-dependent dehydrogenase (short-subunit alcohol dehydrogenase family)
MSDLRRAVVVTGAAGGMGRAVSAALATTGTLVLVDVRDHLLDEAARHLSDVGVETRRVRCDVMDPDQVAGVVSVVTELGGLRSLVHTAGLSPKMADGRQVLEVDLVGTVRMLDALLPHAGPGTAAVCIGSIAGYADLERELDPILEDPLAPGVVDAIEAKLHRPLDADTAYALAKRGVMHACERLAGAWGKRGARIVSVAPGLIDTEMGRLELAGNELMATMVEMTPLKPPGRDRLPGVTSDIAALVAFLCSSAAPFISGCDIRVDGGLVGYGRHVGGRI